MLLVPPPVAGWTSEPLVPPLVDFGTVSSAAGHRVDLCAASSASGRRADFGTFGSASGRRVDLATFSSASGRQVDLGADQREGVGAAEGVRRVGELRVESHQPEHQGADDDHHRPAQTAARQPQLLRLWRPRWVFVAAVAPFRSICFVLIIVNVKFHACQISKIGARGARVRQQKYVYNKSGCCTLQKR